VKHKSQDWVDLSERWGQSTEGYHFFTCHLPITWLFCHEKRGAGSKTTAEWSWPWLIPPLGSTSFILWWTEVTLTNWIREPCSRPVLRKDRIQYWEANTQSLDSHSAALLTELLTPTSTIIYIYLWNHFACTDESLWVKSIGFQQEYIVHITAEFRWLFGWSTVRLWRAARCMASSSFPEATTVSYGVVYWWLATLTFKYNKMGVWSSGVSGRMYQDRCIRTDVSGQMYQDRCIRTDVSGQMYQDRCIRV